MYPLTIVSGYWDITNKHSNKFKNEWFKYSLCINCPYVFFGTRETINFVKEIRKDLPTLFINLNITDFYTYKYISTIEPHSIHCPSKELNLVWNEKTFLIEKAAQINKFNSQYFMWVDAGICLYRSIMPPVDAFPLIDKVNNLPNNKFIFSSSSDIDPHFILKTFDPDMTGEGKYYHYVSGIFMFHKDFIHTWVSEFKKYLDRFLTKNTWEYTDQVIYTIMYKENPQLFHKLCDGYAQIVPYLYGDSVHL